MDPAGHALPERLAQLGLEDLAGPALRQGIPEVDLAWDPVAGEPIATPGPQFPGGGGHIGFEDHDGDRDLTALLIGYSSFFVLIIRSKANPPIDENNPENAISLLSYLKREQYGDWTGWLPYADTPAQDSAAIEARGWLATANERIHGTDYGQALADLHDEHWKSIDRQTTVLILGDGRSNHTDPRLELFRELADRAKRVVWLCTEPAGRWGSGDSCMLRYRPYCTHVSHAATASDIERAIDDALAAYD